MGRERYRMRSRFVLPMSPTLPAASPPGSGDGRAPRTPPERIGLLFLLVILPVALVTLPAILVTAIFGQHPRPAAVHVHEAAPDDSGLRNALEHDAQQAMPQPSALAEEPLVLTVRPDRLAPRIQRIGELAKSLGGSMSQGLPRPDGADLYIDLPASAEGAFRSALAPASPAPSSDAGAGGKVHLEVTLRVARDDE
jgi:hypothetical protein